MIKAGLTYNESRRQFTIHYPWIKNPECLPNNFKVAMAKLRSTESRLQGLDMKRRHDYQDQMEDMLRRGASRKLSPEEIQDYKGPIHYVHYHEIIKENSSTPVRIVFNSSASYLGHALNEYWAKGPDFVNNLFGVLTRFREYQVALITDISKMYNAIHISARDQQVHRYLWRDFQTDRDPDHYALTDVPFGDRPSGTVAMVALHKIADMNEEKYPEAARMIKHNSYVDDLLQSVSSENAAFSLASDVQNVLEQGNFKVKHWVISGQTESCFTGHITFRRSKREKLLGMTWEPNVDQFLFEGKLNFSPQRNAPPKQRITNDNMEREIPELLTKRLLLRQVASIYDPLGIIVPFTLKGKLLMRQLVTSASPKNRWDEPVTCSCRNEWLAFFRDIFELETIRFPRCLMPSNATGDPILIIFSDASSQAYGACAYVRWSIGSDKYKASLISAKNKLAPMRQISIPRLELCAAVIGCRLAETIIREMTYEFTDVMYIVDSIIVRSQIQKESYGFGTFVATRIAEIQEKTKPCQWWWIKGSENPADLVTRPTKPTDLDTGSSWQTGPSFLRWPKDTWPISQKHYEQELPDRRTICLTVVAERYSPDLSNIINLGHFSAYDKLLRITARLLQSAEKRSLSGIGMPLQAELITKAETLWIRHAQKQLFENWQDRFKRLGPSITNEGILVVGSRISKWLKDNWNQHHFILLPAKHKMTELLIQKLHRRDHGGIESTMARLQAKFWIPGARRVIKRVKAQCVTCKILNRQPQTQVMGQVTPERLSPSPAFYNTALDLFGPFLIKDTVKRRTRAKVYGVIFTCLASRAVYLDLVEGYSTEDFLLSFRRFVTLRGYPATLYSDSGSQLVAAKKELQDIIQCWDERELTNWGAKQGLTWKFTKSADAPWQNGCSESLIRLVKRALTMAIGDNILSFGELQTVVFEVANLLNERPIGRKPGADPTAGCYLSPNDLLLGRTQIAPPQGIWAETSRLSDRFLFLQRIVTTFWKKWYRDYFGSLLIRQKWHKEQRDIRPGDIVLVQEDKPLRNKWKLAEVTAVDKSTTDGKIRDATLRYKARADGPHYNGQPDVIIRRPVQRLVLIIEAESRS